MKHLPDIIPLCLDTNMERSTQRSRFKQRWQIIISWVPRCCKVCREKNGWQKNKGVKHYKFGVILSKQQLIFLCT